MFNFILATALAQSPQPASFQFVMEGNRESSVWYNGRQIHPGQIYCTEPIHSVATIELEVQWVHGDRIRRQTMRVLLVAGSHMVIEITVPGRAAVRLCNRTKETTSTT